MIDNTIYPALITPFNDTGEIDTKALTNLMDMQMDAGVTGFYIGGSTSECFLMSIPERKKAMDAAVRHAKGAATAICHVGSISGEDAAELARFAKFCGADAVSAIAPFYYNFTKEEIFGYYNHIMDEGDLPMVLYNFPAFSGVDFTLDDFISFYEDERVVGVKYTSHDLFKMNRISDCCPDWLILNGHDEVFLPSLFSGAKGGVGSTYNFMPKRYLKILDSYKNGDIAAAKKEQETANRVISVLVDVGVFQGIKYILSKMGYGSGQLRAPFLPLDDSKKEKIDDIMMHI